ncbi:MAG: hypothetical protein KDB53_11680, partial [Planctomycetes bacterium]|nr:hypothetical protein [Planctomycetota bacterium]
MKGTKPTNPVAGQPAATLAVWGPLLAAAALLWPVLGMGFTGDDWHLLEILDREAETQPPGPGCGLVFFTRAVSEHFSLYRPLVMTSLGVDLAWHGAEAAGFMVTTVLLHLICGALYFGLLRRLVPEVGAWVTSVATLVFLASPLQLEVATWSSARSETLSFAFGIGALLCKLGRPERRLVPGILLLAALWSKESALVWLPAIAVVDLFGVKTDFARLRRRWWPLGLVVVGWFLLRVFVLGTWSGRYGHVDAGAVGLADHVGRFIHSLAMVLAPVSRVTVELPALRWGLVAGFILAWLVVAFSLAGVRRQGRGLVVALGALLVIVPLGLSVLINPINGALVGSRAAYTPLAGLLLFATL